LIPARDPAYYSLPAVRASIERSLEARRDGIDFMYLIRDKAGNIVGRINLVDAVEEPERSGEIGYRIGERYGGRGYATMAVALLVKEAFGPLGFSRLTAETSVQNVG